MRAYVDFTMARSGAHTPFLRLFPESDADEAFLLAQETSAGGLAGWLTLSGGLGLELRYLARERRSMGQAFFEMFRTSTPEDALAGLVRWLPEATSLSAMHDGRALHGEDQAFYTAFQRVFPPPTEQKIVTRFTLTAEHVLLLRATTVGCRQNDDVLVVELKPAMPGDDYASAICATLGWLPEEPPGENSGGNLRWSSKQRRSARVLYGEMARALQVVLTAGTFEPGTYGCTDFGCDWKRLDPPQV